MHKRAWVAVFCLAISFGLKAQNHNQPQNSLEIGKRFTTQKSQYEGSKVKDGYYLHLQVAQLPSFKEKAKLKKKGIHLNRYLGQMTYEAYISSEVEAQDFSLATIQAIYQPTFQDKVTADLAIADYPEHILSKSGFLDLALTFQEGLTQQQKLDVLASFQAIMLLDAFTNENTIEIQLPENQLKALALNPMVAQVEPISPEPEMLNYETANQQKVNFLKNAVSPLGKSLRGEGVCIGVGDGGELGDHIDFGDRVINYADGTYSSFGAHGDHVAGIVGAGGHINARHEGMAPESQLVIQKTNMITFYAQDYYEDHGMVITNNSYGTSYNCTVNGEYNYSSNTLDKQLRDIPEMMHVFAAGNSGWQTCDPYPDGFRSVLRYYQSAKNVLTVGNVTQDLVINPSSSRGPVADGRLKPEIVGVGTNITSTGRDFNYYNSGGTSMASPAVAGTLGLLYQRYRQLHNGENPKGDLIKAIACNTATDLGNEGPDFTYGFGIINAKQAVSIIENQQYITAEVSNGETDQFTIDVPQNVEEFKVMLYWHDVEASSFPDRALINDLDVTLIDQGGNVIRPWVLNNDAAHVNDLATRGEDHLNNIEQITLMNIPAGTYTVEVNGYEVPQGPQNYVLTYHFVNSILALTHPIGGENFQPGQTELIQWDRPRTGNDTYTIEFTTDNGATWSVVATGVSAANPNFNWTVPNVATHQARIRLTNEVSNTTDLSDASFTILGTPTNLTAESICLNRMLLEWNSVTHAEDYVVYRFDGGEMTEVGSTTDTTYAAHYDYVNGENYWFAVEARIAGTGCSPRTAAAQAIADVSATCPYVSDLSLEDIIITRKGRHKTLSALSDAEPIKIVIRNEGQETATQIEVGYQINGGTPVIETIQTNLVSGESLEYTFTQTANFTQVGAYDLDVWVNTNSDVNVSNDSVIGEVRAIQLDNASIQLPYTENFEDALSKIYGISEMGIANLDEWDFQTNGNGEAIIESSSKSLLIKPVLNGQSAQVDNEAIITLNLINHNLLQEGGLYLNLRYKQEESLAQQAISAPAPDNALYIRGSDQDTWIKLTELQTVDEGWNTINGLDIGNTLAAHSQSLSESFQIRFSQATGNQLQIDDIEIWNDLSLPVNLIEFTAHKVDEDVRLRWVTEGEENNRVFEIQMATENADGTISDFQAIGSVLGNGTTNEVQTYYYDHSIYPISLVRYYRLRQIDLDGTVHYSPIRAVQLGYITDQVSVYPNPFIAQLNLSFESDLDQRVQYAIHDATGRVVIQGNFIALRGYNNPTLPLAEVIPGGHYILRLSGDGIRKTIPIIKTK